MRGFVPGMLVGLALGAGGRWLFLRLDARETPVATVAAAAPATQAAKSGKKRRGAQAAAAGQAEEDDGTSGDAVAVVVSAGDRAMIWAGESVVAPSREVSDDSPDTRPLNETEIGNAMQAGDSAVVRCLRQARGAAELDATVRIKLLVDGRGQVSRSRVQAPRYLIDRGVEPCVRAALRAVKFAPTGQASVVEMPYEVR